MIKTDDEIWGDLVSWLVDKTELKTIKSHESGKRPDNPYLMVNFINFKELRQFEQTVKYSDLLEQVPINSNDENVLVNEGGDPLSTEAIPVGTLAAPMIEGEWQFSIHSYGDNPSEVLRKLKSYSKLSQLHEPLLPNLFIHEVGTINHAPDWINNKWEPRAQCFIFLRGVICDPAAIDTIDEISVDVTRSQ